MAAIGSRNTKPELMVRRAVHAAGFRFQLHRSDLPGRPDMVFPRYGVVAFVHGCFWHGHVCKEAKRPLTNVAYWNPKIEGNMARDRRAAAKLRQSGWKVMVIRECELGSGVRRLIEKLAALRDETRRSQDG